MLDFDSEDAYHAFAAAHPSLSNSPIVRTARGFHIYLKPKRALKSQRLTALGCELKCIGSYVVAPPSVHPSGTPYKFQVPPNGAIPEVDLEALLGLSGTAHPHTDDGLHESKSQEAAPSAFALRYGRSSWPQTMCGKATKVLTGEDGRAKKLLSLRCWRWDCSKCTPLLRRHWLQKLQGLSFRFILRLPTADKPGNFLRSSSGPRYVHIIANGESWLLLLDGEAQRVWTKSREAGYYLVAGDLAGDPTSDDIRGVWRRSFVLSDSH